MSETLFLSIIIPAYNEGERLPDTLALIRDYLEVQSFSAEVLVVNDGSTDNTEEIVRNFAKRFPLVRLVRNETNQGKGAAVQHGMLEAKGEWRLFMDADHSTAITEFDKFLPHLTEADILIGSRYLHPDSIKIKQSFKRRIGSRGFNLYVRTYILPKIVDTQCGFKLFSAKAAEMVFPRQTLKRWAFDVEVLAIAKQLNLKILEIPVDWYDAAQSRFRARQAASRLIKDLQIIRQNIRHKVYVS